MKTTQVEPDNCTVIFDVDGVNANVSVEEALQVPGKDTHEMLSKQLTIPGKIGIFHKER